jgi:hypothetical protein
MALGGEYKKYDMALGGEYKKCLMWHWVVSTKR